MQKEIIYLKKKKFLHLTAGFLVPGTPERVQDIFQIIAIRVKLRCWHYKRLFFKLKP